MTTRSTAVSRAVQRLRRAVGASPRRTVDDVIAMFRRWGDDPRNGVAQPITTLIEQRGRLDPAVVGEVFRLCFGNLYVSALPIIFRRMWRMRQWTACLYLDHVVRYVLPKGWTQPARRRRFREMWTEVVGKPVG